MPLVWLVSAILILHCNFYWLPDGGLGGKSSISWSNPSALRLNQSLVRVFGLFSRCIGGFSRRNSLVPNWSIPMDHSPDSVGDDNEKATTVVADDWEETLKRIGGSQSDDWNHVLGNQALQSLWIKHSDNEVRQRQYNAAIDSLVCVGDFSAGFTEKTGDRFALLKRPLADRGRSGRSARAVEQHCASGNRP
jgi:hypothetical protein